MCWCVVWDVLVVVKVGVFEVLDVLIVVFVVVKFGVVVV